MLMKTCPFKRYWNQRLFLTGLFSLRLSIRIRRLRFDKLLRCGTSLVHGLWLRKRKWLIRLTLLPFPIRWFPWNRRLITFGLAWCPRWWRWSRLFHARIPLKRLVSRKSILRFPLRLFVLGKSIRKFRSSPICLSSNHGWLNSALRMPKRRVKREVSRRTLTGRLRRVNPRWNPFDRVLAAVS